jgi:hypothetical protein
MHDHRIPKTVLSEEIYGKKKQGRPRKCWITDMEEDLRKMNIQG